MSKEQTGDCECEGRRRQTLEPMDKKCAQGKAARVMRTVEIIGEDAGVVLYFNAAAEWKMPLAAGSRSDCMREAHERRTTQYRIKATAMEVHQVYTQHRHSKQRSGHSSTLGRPRHQNFGKHRGYRPHSTPYCKRSTRYRRKLRLPRKPGTRSDSALLLFIRPSTSANTL